MKVESSKLVLLVVGLRGPHPGNTPARLTPHEVESLRQDALAAGKRLDEILGPDEEKRAAEAVSYRATVAKAICSSAMSSGSGQQRRESSDGLLTVQALPLAWRAGRATAAARSHNVQMVALKHRNSNLGDLENFWFPTALEARSLLKASSL